MNNCKYENFPESVSFTITNACNLRCKMCGQWSENGYMLDESTRIKPEMKLSDWKRIIDEIADHNINSVLIRGGEPFLHPNILEILNYLDSKNFFISIDTNGTMLKEYAADLVRIGNIHITVSVDGPEEIHDEVRGVKGCFQKTKENIMYLHELEKNDTKKISKSICFTISPYSYKGLGVMPDVVRSLSIDTINIVPYNFVTGEMQKQSEQILKNELSSCAFSYSGFHHDSSGIDFEIFLEQFREYNARLDGLNQFPYMGSSKSYLTEEDYKKWFCDPTMFFGGEYCANIERLIDIQPDGRANFCVDLPDYKIGNVLKSTIREIWKSNEAEKFRGHIRKKMLPVCYRCVAKYMGEIPDKV
jgi:MoaA/NifB/PqqE/SkfB family radical SAM enzyme